MSEKNTKKNGGKNSEDKGGNDKKDKKKGGISKRKFNLGKTEIRLWDYEHLDIKDQKSWLLYQNRNYTATLHKKRAKIKLLTGEEFIGLIKTRDPFFIGLKTNDDRKVIVNKGAIAFIELLEEGGGDGD